ncbi:restriction endonuclease subunit S [Streptomyces sp. SP18BB07]|uniref:restriction endonuclease subunit S n=1 Tax=Streptomyces sp. SP18BB07 TaxID=3002522 RepID=UPI002E7A5AE3|nr:restriction endonuclease subunit S [Streptomyces sp. SP18BB07]MEE1758496.1 restriction endonuclease subunit S [Streptomyces sp. SP18BB07]
MSGDIPTGWSEATIGDLIDSTGVFSDGDWVESKDQDPAGEVRLVQLADIGDGEFRNRSNRSLTLEKAEQLNCTLLAPGDILIARMPDPLGRACIYPGGSRRAVTVVDVCIVRPSVNVNRQWLMHFVNSPQFRERLKPFESGSTRKRISRKNLAKIRIPVPPAAEQRRIVASLEEQLSRLEGARHALRSIGDRVKAARRSILDEFFGLDASMARGCVVERLEDVARIQSGQTPRRGAVTFDETASDTSVPFWKVGDMNGSDGRLLNRSRTYVKSEDAARGGLKVQPAGTVLIPKRGGAIFTNKKRVTGVAGAFDLNTMGIVPGSRLEPDYLWYWFQTIDLQGLADGSNVPQINNPDLRDLKIPVPGKAEQRRMVARLDEIFDSLDRAEKMTVSAKPMLLRAALLRDAFAGCLVAQDLGDEPADALLASIRAERKAAAPQKRRSPRRPPAQRADRRTPLPAPPAVLGSPLTGEQTALDMEISS